jgi:hypothetical protein
MSGCFFFGSDPPSGPAASGPACTAAFEPAPECTLEGDLVVEIGQGADAYEALADGESPEIHVSAGFQGGSSSHVELGLRVEKHSLEYPELEINFDLLNCPDDDPECQSAQSVEGRLCVLGADDFEYREDGSAEVASIDVFADTWEGVGRKAISLNVEDRCGRVGTALHLIDPS